MSVSGRVYPFAGKRRVSGLKAVVDPAGIWAWGMSLNGQELPFNSKKNPAEEVV